MTRQRRLAPSRGALLPEQVERGIDVCDETIRFWWSRFGPLFPAGIRRQRVMAWL